ncbi:hypothetical protein [Azospirillum tabaci]|uniref:hypothetical protein n=1 Tax=Azospirillum tabaci TaxID=2752310 RepID=UPI0016613C01|nr:hypothetical protein [Azospirillum tabaci]
MKIAARVFGGLSLLIACIGSAAAADPIVNIPTIYLQNKADVQKQLGKPSKCEKIKYGDKCYYKSGNVSVVFINGAADWISVDNISIPYNENSLLSLGLAASKATFANEHIIRWDDTFHEAAAPNASGETEMLMILSLSLFPGKPGEASSVYVKVATK